GSISNLSAAIEAESAEPLKFAMAVQLGKKVKAEELKSALETSMKAEAETNSEMEYAPLEMSTYEGMKMLTPPASMQEEGMPEMVMLVKDIKGGSMLYLGTESEVKSASKAEKAELSSAVKSTMDSMLANDFFWLSITLPDSVRAKIAEQPAPPMLGPAGPALQKLENITFSMNADQLVKGKLAIEFADSASAEAVNNMVAYQVLPMLQMMIAQEGGEVPPMVESLNLGMADGSVSLSFSMTEADLSMLADQAQ
ncbi:MAG: hypothetical protein ACOCVG_04050, partial [Verrucomicrobiota bacterium]